MAVRVHTTVPTLVGLRERRSLTADPELQGGRQDHSFAATSSSSPVPSSLTATTDIAVIMRKRPIATNGNSVEVPLFGFVRCALSLGAGRGERRAWSVLF